MRVQSWDVFARWSGIIHHNDIVAPQRIGALGCDIECSPAQTMAAAQLAVLGMFHVKHGFEDIVCCIQIEIWYNQTKTYEEEGNSKWHRSSR